MLKTKKNLSKNVSQKILKISNMNTTKTGDKLMCSCGVFMQFLLRLTYRRNLKQLPICDNPININNDK